MRHRAIVASVIVLLSMSVVTFALVPTARAFSPVKTACPAESAGCPANPSNPFYGPNGLITKLTTVVAIFTGVAAVFVLVIAGISFMTSGGEPNKIATARRMVLYAIVGIVVAVLAQGIASFVLSKL